MAHHNVSERKRRHKKPVAFIHVNGRVLTYKQYLNSPEWKEKRKRAILRAGGKCQLCGWRPKGFGGGFNVHHNTYDHIGKEFEHDLCVLCKECHEMWHKHRKHAKRREKMTYRGEYAWKPNPVPEPTEVDRELDAAFADALGRDSD